MNAVDYRKSLKKEDNFKKKINIKLFEEPILITCEDVIYKPSNDNKKKKENKILIEKKTGRVYNNDSVVNKKNKKLLIDYIMQEVERINDLDYL